MASMATPVAVLGKRTLSRLVSYPSSDQLMWSFNLTKIQTPRSRRQSFSLNGNSFFSTTSSTTTTSTSTTTIRRIRIWTTKPQNSMVIRSTSQELQLGTPTKLNRLDRPAVSRWFGTSSKTVLPPPKTTTSATNKTTAQSATRKSSSTKKQTAHRTAAKAPNDPQKVPWNTRIGQAKARKPNKKRLNEEEDDTQWISRETESWLLGFSVAVCCAGMGAAALYQTVFRAEETARINEWRRQQMQSIQAEQNKQYNRFFPSQKDDTETKAESETEADMPAEPKS